MKNKAQLMDLPPCALDAMQESEMLLVVGGNGSLDTSAANNGDGVCIGTNNSSGICTGTNNSSGLCGVIIEGPDVN